LGAGVSRITLQAFLARVGFKIHSRAERTLRTRTTRRTDNSRGSGGTRVSSFTVLAYQINRWSYWTLGTGGAGRTRIPGVTLNTLFAGIGFEIHSRADGSGRTGGTRSAGGAGQSRRSYITRFAVFSDQKRSDALRASRSC